MKPKEAANLALPVQLQIVRVARPKNVVTTVADVDDIDVRDGSLLLLRRATSGRETCMMVFSPGQWISANVEPV
jgi:mannose-6-phosphate isomerase-like protein (cupin superfamily)